MSDPNPNTDMEAFFGSLNKELGSRSKHIEELRNTLATFQENPDLFDEKDIVVTQTVLSHRHDEYQRLSHDFVAAQELYRATVLDLEAKVREKEEILRKVDSSFGVISAEEELRLHFAQKQAHLHKGLARAKAQLCATIFEKLKL